MHVVHTSAILAIAGGSALASAVWGVRYEVDTGSGWTRNATVDVGGGSKVVDFRIFVYHDGQTLVRAGANNVLAVNPLRLCMTHKLQNFGSAASGDGLISFDHSVQVSNAVAKETALSGNDFILGRPNDALSFASNLADGLRTPPPAKSEVEFYRGQIRIGNATPGALNRLLSFTANTFSAPNANDSQGGPFGASFLYNSPGAGDFGLAQESATVLGADIAVIPSVATTTPLFAALALAARRRRA